MGDSTVLGFRTEEEAYFADRDADDELGAGEWLPKITSSQRSDDLAEEPHRTPTPTASGSLSPSPSPSPGASGSTSRVSSPRPIVTPSPTIHLLASNKRATSAALLEIPGTGGAPSTLLAVSVSGLVGIYATNRWRPQRTYRLWDNTGSASGGAGGSGSVGGPGVGGGASSTAGGGGSGSGASAKAKCWVTNATFMEFSKHLVFSTSDQRLIIYDASASTHLREYEVSGLPSLVTSMQAVVLDVSPKGPSATSGAERDVPGNASGLCGRRDVGSAMLNSRSEVTNDKQSTRHLEDDDGSGEELLVLGDYRGFVRVLRFLQPHNVLIPKGEADAGQVQFVGWQDLASHRDYVSVETMSTSHGGPVARAKYLKEKGWLLSCSKDPHHALILHHPVAMLPPHHFLGAAKGICSCDYSSSCGLIAGGSWDGTILLWSPMTPQQPFTTLPIPSSRLQDIAFIHSTLFCLSRDAKLSIWDVNSERLLRSSPLDFPAKKVLGKHLEYPAAALIPWTGGAPSNASNRFPQTLVIGCCDYLAWMGLEWVLADGSSTSEPSTPLPGSGAESFEWDKVPPGLVTTTFEGDHEGLSRSASLRSNQSHEDYQQAEVDTALLEGDVRRSSSASPGVPDQQQLLGRSARSRMLSVPTAANLYNERILVQVNRAMNFIQGILVDPHTFAREQKEISRSASDRRRNRSTSGKTSSKWNLPKIQSLRLATPSRASMHLAMCKQELSRNKMLLNVDMGLPYCALNMMKPVAPGGARDADDGGGGDDDNNQTGGTDAVQLPITRSVSSQF